MLSFTIYYYYYCYCYLFALFSLVAHASPLGLNERDVYNPPVLVPNAQTVWTAGSQQTVVWDITNLPPDSQLTRPTGKLILGQLTDDSLNLRLSNPLAQGFMLRDAKADITLPSDLPTATNYIIVLMGDSGNHGAPFTILAAGDGAAAPPVTSTVLAPIDNAPVAMDPIASSPGAAATADPASTTTTIAPAADSDSNSNSDSPVSNAIPLTGSIITGGIATTPVAITRATANATGTGTAESANTGAPGSDSGSVTARITSAGFVASAALSLAVTLVVGI